jgi:dolichyl-phosphate-mannose-protein mannosyltransferase
MPRVAVYIAVPLVLAIAALARLAELDVTRLSGASYDEAVYATAARLFLHGIIPFRDYFFGHPPVGAFVFSPAMLLDSTSWGGPGSFAAARQLSLDYGLISVVLVFAIGYRLAGLWGATAASLAWSLDPRAIGLSTQVILDGPMVMFSFAAILAYLAVHPALASQASPRRQMIGLALAGGLAALSALTKGVGVTLLIAIVIDLAWQRLRPGAGPRRGFARRFGSVLLGAGGVSSIALLPFVIAAPGELLRQVVFFQLLRPREAQTLGDRIGTLAERPDQWPILVLAGIGLAVVIISVAVSSTFQVRHREHHVYHLAHPVLAGWSLVLIWAVANALVFASTPRIELHYRLHVLAPLALIAAGVGLVPLWLESAPRLSAQLRRWEVPALMLVLGVVIAQQAPSWIRTTGGSGSTTYGRLSDYINQTVPSEARVFVLDARVTFIAGREPSRGASGYLVDPYGHLAYLGLELGSRGPAEMVLAVVRREENRWSRMVRSRSAQADLLARFADTDVVVVHKNELWRFGPGADALKAMATDITRVGGYLVYSIDPSSGHSAESGRRVPLIFTITQAAPGPFEKAVSTGAGHALGTGSN